VQRLDDALPKGFKPALPRSMWRALSPRPQGARETPRQHTVVLFEQASTR